MICAAPSYLVRRGTPQHPDQLIEHDCLLLSDAPSLSRWPFSLPDSAGGANATVEVKGRVTAGSADALLRLAVAGAGIIRMGDVIVADAIRAGELVPLLEDSHIVEPVPMSAVYPSGRHRSPKVRVFVDWLIDTFRSEPWRVTANHAPTER